MASMSRHLRQDFQREINYMVSITKVRYTYSNERAITSDGLTSRIICHSASEGHKCRTVRDGILSETEITVQHKNVQMPSCFYGKKVERKTTKICVRECVYEA